MTREQLDGFEWNMPAISAGKTLEQARLGQIELTAASWHDLTLLATGDKEAAEMAYQAVVKSKLKRGERPE